MRIGFDRTVSDEGPPAVVTADAPPTVIGYYKMAYIDLVINKDVSFLDRV
jgi:hypothetical protein